MKASEKQSVEKEVLSLGNKTLVELREMWKRLFNSNPPPHAKKILIPHIAYKLQEIAYGGLSEKSIKQIDNLADQMRQGKKVRGGNGLVVGTRIIKKYQGEEHEVIVMGEKVFIYKGQPYKSLTAIANKITGTKWNGLVFWGVKNVKAN